MKPCRSTIQSFSTQKITRAIRPCGKLLRTSHSSRPSERTSGIPIGQESISISVILSGVELREAKFYGVGGPRLSWWGEWRVKAFRQRQHGDNSLQRLCPD